MLLNIILLYVLPLITCTALSTLHIKVEYKDVETKHIKPSTMKRRNPVPR